MPIGDDVRRNGSIVRSGKIGLAVPPDHFSRLSFGRAFLQNVSVLLRDLGEPASS
ncbi:MAG TPA: hypothetical protein VLV78_01455 [Thermoanaerobaculia bacterium]|nr:hypothetical protein [Thermoanaerobaculia bacterium]